MGDADTTIQGVLDLFGPKDLYSVAQGTDLFASFIMQAHADEDKDLFDRLSPSVQASKAPSGPRKKLGRLPWLGVIGTSDLLVSAEQSVDFADLARARLTSCFAFCLLEGAHHGFAGMPSVRCLALADAAVALMADVAGGHRHFGSCDDRCVGSAKRTT